MTLGLAAGGRDRAGAKEFGEGGLAGDAVGVVASNDEQVSGDVGADADRGGQLRGNTVGQFTQKAFMAGDFVQLPPAARDRTQGVLRGRFNGAQVPGP